MTERAEHLGRRMFLLVTVWVALTPSFALAQSTAPTSPTATATAAAAAATPPADPTLGITFDVVSIRPAPEGPSRVTNPLDGDGITIENSTLLEIVRWNFNMSSLREDQLQGIPKWFTTDNYEIRAKVAESDIAAWRKIGEGGHRLVLRKMLAERFKFAWHFADIDSPVYNLVIAKGGLKIKEAKPDEASPFDFKTADGSLNADGSRVAYKGAGITMRAAPGGGYWMYVMQQLHMSSFAKNFLSNVAGRPVVDKTGLLGAYNFSLDFAGEGLSAAPSLEGSASEPSRPSIFTALQEQLGLKLEPAKGPVSHLIVDHLERPSEN